MKETTACKEMVVGEGTGNIASNRGPHKERTAQPVTWFKFQEYYRVYK